jgi:nicotinate-nucleotide adenylyltransferase
VEFHIRSSGRPRRLGVLPGTFNPPTRAHLELVYAAGFHVDEVLCVVPRSFPHKEYFGATLSQRLDMLAFAEIALPYSVATSDAGLFLDIARECREHYGADVQLSFVCGRDAAERVLTWDYGRPGVAAEMLREFELLVAARQGEFEAPPQFRERIHSLYVRGEYDALSSTEVRERIMQGEPWEHLVPETIVERVRAIYGADYS